MKRVLIYTAAVLLLAFGLAGCAQKSAASDLSAGDGKISIVTTIFPPYDFARAITGGLADVRMLIDPGAEVHTFDPSTDDIIRIQNADVFIYTGGENDAWVNTVLESMDTQDKTVIRLMDTVTPLEEETVEGMQAEAAAGKVKGEYDEHVWTSPKNAMQMIGAISEALCGIDAANAGAYRQNAADYSAQIKTVDEQIQAVADASENKLLIVADRFPFRYLTEEFGLDYRAAYSGCSSETEVSAGTLAYLINTIETQHIGYIYYIEMSNQDVAEILSEQTGAQMLLLHSCHNVTKKEFDAGATYLSLMRQNAKNLETGLE